MGTLGILVAKALKQVKSEIIAGPGLQLYHLHIIFDHEDEDGLLSTFTS